MSAEILFRDVSLYFCCNEFSGSTDSCDGRPSTEQSTEVADILACAASAPRMAVDVVKRAAIVVDILCVSSTSDDFNVCSEYIQ